MHQVDIPSKTAKQTNIKEPRTDKITLRICCMSI